jgi:LPS export ABC transporter permease LptF/LPS export ABC transporter permease LptG
MHEVSKLRFLRPSLLDRYIGREIIAPTLLGLVLFTFVLLLQEIAILTGFLVSRSADIFTIIRVFFNLLPHILATTIPMAVLLGVLLAFGRMASESEIVALRASGVSPARLMRPVLALGLLAGLLTLYITTFGYPNANQSHRELTFSLMTGQAARNAIKPRVFTDDLVPSGNMILYVSDIASGSGEWRNLFVSDTRSPKQPRVILAKSGRLVIEKDRRDARLELSDGAIYAFRPTSPDTMEVSQFQEREVRLPFDEIFPPQTVLGKGHNEMTIVDLIQEIRKRRQANEPEARIAPYIVEVHKRLAIPAACIVFGVLGLGLSLGNRKEARSAAFSVSIGVIFVYFILFRLGEQAGDTGVLPPSVAMWAANALFAFVAVVLLVLNHKEAAFDPLDPALYTRWVPTLRVVRRAAAHAAPVSRLRLSSRRARFGSILDNYIARLFLSYLALILIAFCSLYLLVEFMELFDDLQQNRVKGVVMVNYLFFFAPTVIQLITPVGFLVATLTTLGVLSRRNEITAMKAGGISLYRVTLPIVIVALLGSACLFGLGDFVLPFTNRVANRHKNTIKGRPPQSARQLKERWVLGSDGRFYSFTAAGGGVPDTLLGLSAFDVERQSWKMREMLYANQARWNAQGAYYDMEHGWRRSLGPGGGASSFVSARTREIETPEYFGQEARDTDTLRFGELRTHITAMAALGMDVVRLQVQLHNKLSFPFVTVVMTMIGIPFAFVVGRRGALYGVGISLIVAIVYWSCLKIFEALGAYALLPPALAMWAPNILFGSVGVYLLFGLET